MQLDVDVDANFVVFLVILSVSLEEGQKEVNRITFAASPDRIRVRSRDRRLKERRVTKNSANAVGKPVKTALFFCAVPLQIREGYIMHGEMCARSSCCGVKSPSKILGRPKNNGNRLRESRF